MWQGKQCKDMPERPFLAFVEEHGRCTWFGDQFPNSVTRVTPGAPAKLVLAKMRQMIKKGLLDGCACGCRGDFTLTEKGRAMLHALMTHG